MSLKFSICIPTYEANNKGCELLTDLLMTIQGQTYDNYEVIVSDHSKNNDIKNLITIWEKKLNVKHIFCEKGRGNSSINMNNAIKHSTGDFIKIMHMDDRFSNPNVLETLNKSLSGTEYKWGGLGFIHYHENENIFKDPASPFPQFDGENFKFFGCPSISFFKHDRNNMTLFDENLIIINDLDMHKQLYELYGAPLVIPEISIIIRIHDDQVYQTHRELEEKEWRYYKNKIHKKDSKNMDNFLTELANKYSSDKGTTIPNDGRRHGPRLHFSTIYGDYLEKIRYDKLNFLEIGIGGGPSLKMWYEFFPNATIHAIDINDCSGHNNDRVTTHVCDQGNREQLESLMEKIGPLDVILDDGSHVIEHQLVSLGTLFKHLKKGGQYWIEDLHTSDGEVWQGKTLYGYDMSFKEGQSTVNVLERYIDENIFSSNHLTKNENEFLTKNIKDMKMFLLPKTMWGINKLCLINKQ